MRATDIKIAGIKTFQIKELKISHRPNEHAKLMLEGYISETEVETVKRLALVDEVVQVSMEEAGDKQLWCGYMYDMEIQHLLHETYLKMTLISQSVKMDREKKTRSFQKPGTKIGDIIAYICKKYQATVIVNGADKQIDGMVVQYQETDWEFLKRLASQLNEQVIVYSKYVSLVMDAGIQASVGAIIQAPSQVTYRSDIQSLRRALDYELSEADVEQVIFESRELYEMADIVQTTKGEFVIYDIESGFQQEELVLKYIGYRRKNYKTPIVRNKQIIGASLNGKVHAVSGSKLQVDLDVDAGNTLCGNKEFSYATVYSSETGTGWYCMPEIGDTVRVYFPSDRERNAYAISSVHLDVQIDHSRSNPEIKSISNAQNKQVVFAPDGIMIQNTENMYVMLSDTNGIEIKSDLPISIHSDTNVTISANQDIEIGGKAQVALKQGTCGTTIAQGGAPTTTAVAPTTQDATVLLSEGMVTVSGVEFRLQENEGNGH